MLRISTTLSLPLSFVTQTTAILAKKGSGKSYTASVIAEELLDAHQQVIVLDPTGAWHGLRSSEDGRSPGYEIAVLGGDFGDLPLNADAGAVIAEAAVAERFSVVLDLSLFTEGEAVRFVAAFLHTLYRLNRQAMHLVIDEADAYAPQKPFSGDEMKCLGACQVIVKRGRKKGIGCTLITQRPSVINKNVLSQVDMLVALRMNHPRDLAAVKEWVAGHDDGAVAKDMIKSLPSLPIGEAWLWAPGATPALFERVKVRRRRTFDSGKTPEAGEVAVTPKVLARADLAKLGARIAATVEQVKDTDPKALRAELARVRAELADLRAAPPPAPVVTFAAELEALKGAVGRAINQLGEGLVEAGKAVMIPMAAAHQAMAARASVADDVATPPRRAPQREPKPASRPSPPGSLGKAQRLMLVIALRMARAVTKTEIGILSGYSPTSSTTRIYLGELISRGLLERVGADYAITAAGRGAVDRDDVYVPSPRERLDGWAAETGAPGKLLRAIVAAHPRALTKGDLERETAYSSASSTMRIYLGELKKRGLIVKKGDGFLAAPPLFLEVPR